MPKGKIIYLNGVTSAGKTSIINALRATGFSNFYYLSDDIFEDHIIDVEYDDPAYWSTLAEAVFLMYKTAKLFSDHGKNVIIDSMLLERPEFGGHYQKLCNIFNQSPLRLVLVYCPLEICRQRNLQRVDRYEFQSHEQSEVMADIDCYDLILDTSLLDPVECAKKIKQLLI